MLLQNSRQSAKKSRKMSTWCYGVLKKSLKIKHTSPSVLAHKCAEREPLLGKRFLAHPRLASQSLVGMGPRGLGSAGATGQLLGHLQGLANHRLDWLLQATYRSEIKIMSLDMIMLQIRKGYNGHFKKNGFF